MVDTTEGSGLFSSLILDKQDNPAIAYFYDGQDELRFAKWTGSRWNVRTIRKRDRPGWYASMAADRYDVPYIVHMNYDPKNYSPITAIYQSSTGTDGFSDGGTISGHSPTSLSVDFDPNNRLYLAFMDRLDGSIYLYTNSGVRWGLSRVVYSHAYAEGAVPGGTANGANVALAIDNRGAPHIAFGTDQNGLLYDGPSGTEVVDEGYAQFISLAIGPDGNPVISYYDFNSHSLKLAVRSGRGWGKPMVVDDSGNVGKFSSVKVDGTGAVHIGYFDEINGALKVAWVYDDQKVLTTVDQGEVGWWISLNLNSKGLPCISYLQYRGGAMYLKYAWAVQ